MSDSSSSQDNIREVTSISGDYFLDNQLLKDTALAAGIVSNAQDAIDLSRAKNEETLAITRAKMWLSFARTVENCTPDVLRNIFICVIIAAGVILSVKKFRTEASVVFATTGMAALNRHGNPRKD